MRRQSSSVDGALDMLFNAFRIGKLLRVYAAVDPKRRRRALRRGHSRLLDLLKREIADAILTPVLIVKVPPLSFIYSEAFSFHRRPQQRPVPTL